MVNVSVTKIDSKGRIQLPATFIVANDLKIGQVLTLKPMVNKKNSNGVFRYCNLLNENDQNLSFEKKYILFYRPNIIYKLKIPEFLLFIYRFFHFKE